MLLGKRCQRLHSIDVQVGSAIFDKCLVVFVVVCHGIGIP